MACTKHTEEHVCVCRFDGVERLKTERQFVEVSIESSRKSTKGNIYGENEWPTIETYEILHLLNTPTHM